nr:MAG TPA: hypothetical protein [Microviridae sp.]
MQLFVENLLKVLKVLKKQLRPSGERNRKVTSCSSYGAPRLAHDLLDERRCKTIRLGKMHKRGLTSLFFFYILKAVKQLRSTFNEFHFYKNNFTKEVNCSDHPKNQNAV